MSKFDSTSHSASGFESGTKSDPKSGLRSGHKTQSKKILIGITGSIAAYKIAGLTSRLVQAGHDVKVILTDSAKEFVGRATFEGLTGNPVYDSTFQPGAMMEHIELARWADIVLVAPATANIVAQMANGFASDLLSTTILATEKSKTIYIAPAMNTQMWNNPAFQRNLNTLVNDGFKIIKPNAGHLACGEIGIGKMAEPEEIFSIIWATNDSEITSEIDFKTQPNAESQSAIQTQDTEHLSNGSILITLGGTQEPIDAVRSITNSSTGQTGIDLCRHFLNENFRVTALVSESALHRLSLDTHLKQSTQFKIIIFKSHLDLQNAMQIELSEQKFDHVVHLAAVSDYTVDQLYANDTLISDRTQIKVGTSHSLTLKLKPTNKIIDSIRGWSKSKIKNVVGFKLTNNANAIEKNNAIQKLLEHSHVDLVVHNDQSQFDNNRGQHKFYLCDKNGKESWATGTKELAQKLLIYFNLPAQSLNAIKNSQNNSDIKFILSPKENSNSENNYGSMS